jgi:hypothetical protein
MTSFAFILGVVPLILGHGAGSEMRRVLGVAVFAGMLGVTLFGIFLTPVFFYVIEGFQEIPLFSSARARMVGKVLLYLVGIVTLGIPWLLIVLLGRLTRRPTTRPTAPAPVAGPRQPALVGDGRSAHDGAAVTGNGHTTTNGQNGTAALPDDDTQGVLHK